MAKDPLAAAGEGPGRRDPLELERVRGARAGHPDDVDAWFGAEHGHVYRLCFGFLAHAAEAEDLAQDAMLHLLDHLDDWDPERPYGPWRDAVVLNLCRDRARRSEARRRAHRAAGERGAESEEARASDPHRELERAEVQTVLGETLAALTPREREVFVLRDLEQRSTEETARCLAIEPSSVRSMLTLARRRLRGLLERRFGSLVAEGGLPGGGDVG